MRSCPSFLFSRINTSISLSYSSRTCAPEPSPAPLYFSGHTPAPPSPSSSEEPKTECTALGHSHTSAGYRVWSVLGTIPALALLTTLLLILARKPLAFLGPWALLAHLQLAINQHPPVTLCPAVLKSL